MGINAEHWGKQGWHFIHSIAWNYPENPTEDDKNDYLAFLGSLEKVLPCPICGQHFKENMAKNPPKMANKEEFFNWSVDMHNEVNKMNGKRVLSYEEAFEQLLINSRTKDQLEEIIKNNSINANLMLSRIKRLKK
jgi:FAD-linked sulfhydryl oxidase